MSHTISVKYIPNTTIDYFNTMINAVDTSALGYLLTVHVETFSCRMSRADKQTFENQRKEWMQHNQSANGSSGSTPHNTYSTSVTPQHRYEDEGDFRFDNDPPPSSQSQQNSTFPAAALDTPPATPPLSFLSPNSMTQQGLQSGRPCFPEFFTFPPSVSGGMGQSSASNLTMGSASASGAGGGGMGSNAPSNSGYFGLPPLDMTDGSTAQQSAPAAAASNNASHLVIPTTAEEAYALSLHIISERLVYLVGTLNSLYGTAEYDFSVLEPTDFVLVNPLSFINEVTAILSQLPPEMHSYTGQNGEAFWRAIGAMIGGESALYDAQTNLSECDVFLFRCPNCDPMTQTKLWSQHYFIYNKKHRVMVSVVSFGDNTLYQGNNQIGYGSGASGADGRNALAQDYNTAVDHHKFNGIPTEISNGEYYTDGYGNVHAIGGGDGYGDDDCAVGGGKGGYNQYTQTPTDPDGDTPQYTHASMTDAPSEWGGEM